MNREREEISRGLAAEGFNSGANRKLRSVLEKFWRATRSVAHCFTGDSSTFLFRKIQVQEIQSRRFLEGRSSNTLRYNTCPTLPVRVLKTFAVLEDRQTPFR